MRESQICSLSSKWLCAFAPSSRHSNICQHYTNIRTVLISVSEWTFHVQYPVFASCPKGAAFGDSHWVRVTPQGHFRTEPALSERGLLPLRTDLPVQGDSSDKLACPGLGTLASVS